MFNVLSIIIALALVLGGAGGALVSVADAAAPGDPLYGIDRQVEALRLDLTFNQESAQKLQEQFLQERLEEAQQLVARGDQEHLEQVLQEINQSVGEGFDIDPTLQGGAAPGAADDGPDDDLTAYCDGSAGKHHPVGDKLAAVYGVEYDEIMKYACDGYGFGDIRQAYQISQAAEVPVAEVFAKFDALQDWGQVRAAYNLQKGGGDDNENGNENGNANENDNENDNDNGNDNGDDGNENEDGEGKQPKEGTFCNGTAEKNHPAGEKLAKQFGVSYEEIMAYFCSGYGFGEITLAYQISQAAGVSVDDVFAKRASGMGWGTIMQEYGLNGKDKPKTKTNPSSGSKPSKPPKPTPKPKKNPGGGSNKP